jgi:hypothetical protein
VSSHAHKPNRNADKLPPTLKERYALVCDRIARAAQKAGRKPSDILLVAVTKHAEPEQIKEMLSLGHRDFGENRAQVLLQHASIAEEASSRMRMHARGPSRDGGHGSLFDADVDIKPVGTRAGATSGVRWHMIGHLQRNKAKKIFDIVRLVHSVDSLRIAEELQALAVKKDTPVEVLLQVNCSGEEQKFGCPIPAAFSMAEQLATMVNIRLRGLMTMAAETANADDARPTFARCRDLFEEMRSESFAREAPFNILSMGMSGDFESAIAEGANVVRVGSAIFGDSGGTPQRAELEEEDEA